PEWAPRLDPAAEAGRGRHDHAGRRLELAGPVELPLVVTAPDERVELDPRLAQGWQLPRRRDEDTGKAGVVQGLGVAADEVDSVQTGELPPRQPAVAAARSQLLAEHRDRPLARLVDVRERA